ncbi:MAG: hypothetical protein ACREJC_07865 [Tepidisphaeraceae bacterium]
MMSQNQQEMLRKLASICELSPTVRLGQLLSHLGFLAEDTFDRGLADVQDDELLGVLQRHEAELARRHSNVA